MAGLKAATIHPPSVAQFVIQRMALRCLLAMLVLGAMILAAFLVNQWQVQSLNQTSMLIGRANRQRSNIVHARLIASRLANTVDRNEISSLQQGLSTVIADIDAIHSAMVKETSEDTAPYHSRSLRPILYEPPQRLDDRIRTFLVAARNVSQLEPAQIPQHEVSFQAISIAAKGPDIVDALSALVSTCEGDSRSRQRILRTSQTTLLALTLMLVVATGAGVFWPLIRYAMVETEKLERTNAALDSRAEELATTLKELEQERDERRSQMQEMSKLVGDLEEERGKLEREIQARQLVQDALESSEQRFFAIFELAPTAMIMSDPKGEIVLANDRTEAIFGYAREELLGKPFDVLVPGQWDESPSQNIEGTRFRSEPRQFVERELIGVRKDGSKFPVEIGRSPIDAEEGLFVLSAIVDITERKHHERTLRQSEERVRSIVNSALDAVVTIDEAGRITGWNPQAEVVFEWSADEVLGKTMAELIIPPEYRVAHIQGVEHFLVTGEGPVLNRRLELTAIRKNGVRFPVEISISPLRIGNRYEFSAFVRDITARRSTEREIKRINKELRRKNDEMQQFVYTVSHDLKSPLVTCRGFVGLMKEDAAEGKWDDVLDSIARIERATKRMADLIEDLLLLSRIGVIRNEPEVVDVNQLVRSIADDFADRLRHAGGTLEIQSELPSVKADRVRLGEVFENLVSNAIKYGCTERDGRIWVGGSTGDEEVLFFVRDNGPGIAKEFHAKIFGLFQRLDSSQEGTGVGLAAVARIMEIHGGRVWVESESGNGTTFWIAFPADLDERVPRLETDVAGTATPALGAVAARN